MLPDWYFCCAIEAEPDATHAILGILETLAHSRTLDMREAAFDELARTELWTQVYVLPVVIRSMQVRSGGRTMRLAAETRYFDHLVEFSQAAYSDVVRECLWALGSEGRVKRAEPLVTAADLFLKTPAAPVTATTPYLDIPDFVGETVLAAVLASQLEGDEVSGSIVQALETRGVLYRFVELALEGRFGRLAFCLAARVAAHVITGYDDVTLFKHVTAAGVLALEPDLLDVYARMLFRDGPTNGLKRLVSKGGSPQALTESRQRMSAHDEDVVRDRIGMPASTERPMDLSIVLWRATLLWRLAQVDADGAAQVLAARWAAQGEQDGRGRPWIPSQNGAYFVQRDQVEPLAALLSSAVLATHLLPNLPTTHPSRRQ